MIFAAPAARHIAALLLCAISSWCSASPQVEALLDRAYAIRSSDPDEFGRVLGKLNSLVDEATPPQRENIRYLTAYKESFSGNFASAIADLRALFDGATDESAKFRAGAFLVNNYALTRDFNEGFRYLEQTLSLTQKLDDPDLKDQGGYVAALFYNQIGQFRVAIQYAESAEAETQSPRSLCFLETVRTEAMLSLKTMPSSDDRIQSSIASCRNLGEKIQENFLRSFLARKWIDESRSDQAEHLLQDHLAEVESTRYPRLISEVHSLLARLNLMKKDLADAERHAQRAIELSAGNTYALPIVDAYKVLYDIALARGDTEQALARYRHYAEADKAHLNDVKAREIAYQLARQQTAQKNQTIALLNQQNEVLRLQQQVTAQAAQNDRLRLIIVAALLVLLLGSVVFWGFKVKRLQGSLRRLAEIDTLTGVCNRHHFTECAERVLAQAQRGGVPIALVIFDLDHFKSINDNHGHPAGDLVLRHATALCRRHVREGDLIGRLGGEEFALLLRDCDHAAAAQIAEDCRRHLADLRVRHEDAVLRVTASFGVACAATSGYALKELVAHADQALYAAKRGGRNRVTVHAQAA